MYTVLKYNKIVLLIVIFICPILSSAATYFDANYLQDAYRDYKAGNNNTLNTRASAEFTGYVRGIATVMVAEKAICITRDFSIEQALDSVGELMANNPEEADYPAAAIVADALISAFPCKR
ncbi:hypothetical protein HAX39_24670 [Citrobacter freundii]|nr:hypothetical protein [Citrobacter freundii]